MAEISPEQKSAAVTAWHDADTAAKKSAAVTAWHDADTAAKKSAAVTQFPFLVELYALAANFVSKAESKTAETN